jgi:hypothetical protein
MGEEEEEEEEEKRAVNVTQLSRITFSNGRCVNM